MNGQTSSTNWGCIAGVAVVVAVICSLLAIPMAVSAVTTDPHEWVREHYAARTVDGRTVYDLTTPAS